MSNQEINAPIRILLLGSNTEVGNALLSCSKDQGKFEWICPTETQLLRSTVTSELESLEYDFAVDALSLYHVLQDDYNKIQYVLALLLCRRDQLDWVK